MSRSSVSGAHDRRGFEVWLRLSMFMIVVSFGVLVLQDWKIGLALLMFFCISFTTLEAVSARPDNNPQAFLRWSRKQDKRKPVLLCLGDSLTHGNMSASITPEIPLKLTETLGLPVPNYGATFTDPVWVVNAGQNGITSHTVLYERLSSSMAAAYPDYVLLWIGTNDVRGIYKRRWGRHVRRTNQLPSGEPNMQAFERNVSEILKFVRENSQKVQVGVCTLPPMGENLRSRANDVVREANAVIERVVQKAGDKVTLIPVYDTLEAVLEKKRRRFHWPVELLGITAAIQNVLFHMLFSSWNLWSTGVVLTDGLHLNERGRDVVVDLIVDWLNQKNIAKAIAVKS
jgi:lysophospholipase L1-like esterase